MLEQLKALALKKAEEMKLQNFAISINARGTEVDVSCYNGQLQFTVTAADIEKKPK